MLRVFMVGGPPEGESTKQFDFEWGIVHIALTLTTPASMRYIRRYTQSRTIALPEALVLPLAPEKWQFCCTDHLYDGLEAFSAAADEDYTRRILPHAFAGPNTLIQLSDPGTVLLQQSNIGPRPAAKLLSLVKRRSDLDLETFQSQWMAQLDPCLEDAVEDGLIQKVVRALAYPADPQMFAGTPFAGGSINEHDGIEELLFRDAGAMLDYLEEYGGRPGGWGTLIDKHAGVTLPLKERVVFDQTGAGPRPAILDPNSLEASVYASEPKDGAW